MTFDPTICASEDVPARRLAEASGHGWVGVLQPVDQTAHDAAWLHERRVLPLGLPFATSVRANHAAFRERGMRVVLEGVGGELFVASPLATLDLARAGHLASAVTSARSFSRSWVYGYRNQVKIAARAIVPRGSSASASRGDRVPRGPSAVSADARSTWPWLARRSRIGSGSCCGRARTESATMRMRSTIRVACASSRPSTIDGSSARRYVSPRLSLIPDPEPKWPLRDAVLEGWSTSRVKADQGPWFRAVADRAWVSVDRPSGPGSLIVANHLVDPTGRSPRIPPPGMSHRRRWCPWRAGSDGGMSGPPPDRGGASTPSCASRVGRG